MGGPVASLADSSQEDKSQNSQVDANHRRLSWRLLHTSKGKLLLVEIVVLIVLLCLPAANSYYLTNLIALYLIYGLFAVSVDLVWGYTGLFSFGQAAFFGAGAYTVALLRNTSIANSGILGILIGTAVSIGIAAVLSYFLFSGRKVLGGVYFSLVTLAIAYLFERTALDWTTVMGGYNGIPGIPYLSVFGFQITSGPSFYFFVLSVLVIVYLLVRKIVNSEFGLVLKGIRENESRVRFLGYNSAFVKAITFVAGGGIAGLAGTLFAYQNGFVAPALLGVALSIEVLLWVVVGGRATLIGGVIGVILVRLASQYLSGWFVNFWQLFIAVLLIAIIMLFPGGLLNSLVLKNRQKG